MEGAFSEVRLLDGGYGYPSVCCGRAQSSDPLRGIIRWPYLHVQWKREHDPAKGVNNGFYAWRRRKGD